MATKRKAICLISGGLDSATMLAIAKEQGFDVFAMTFDYGQRHGIEVKKAAIVAQQLQVFEHRNVKIDLGAFGGSSLTSGMPVPKNRSSAEMDSGIPSTYVPARNTIFLSFALAWAEVIGAKDIFIGVNALDYTGYPDCRPEYIAAFQAMARLATKAGVEGTELTIHTPLINLTKTQIIARGLELGVDYSETNTCYSPTIDGLACGFCDACQIRLSGFEENSVEDPVKYEVCV